MLLPQLRLVALLLRLRPVALLLRLVALLLRLRLVALMLQLRPVALLFPLLSWGQGMLVWCLDCHPHHRLMTRWGLARWAAEWI